jgi:hypothetical protein
MFSGAVVEGFWRPRLASLRQFWKMFNETHLFFAKWNEMSTKQGENHQITVFVLSKEREKVLLVFI